MKVNIDRKLAIILRGPPATGKSTIAEAICASASTSGRSAKMVNLDHGWSANERPAQNGGPARYPELVSCEEDVLVIELAQGEPCLIGVPGEGATLNPSEWLNLIKPGRAVFSFLLWADWDHLAAWLRKRGATDLGFFEKCYRLHQDDALFRDFAVRGGILEQRISVPDKTPTEICELILSTCSTRIPGTGQAE